MIPNNTSCPLCGSLNIRHFKKIASDRPVSSSLIPIYACNVCLLEWQFPIYHNSDTSKHFFEKAYKDSKNSYFTREGTLRRCHMQADYIDSLQLIPTTHLDVGGGNGIFSFVMAERGWESTAVDPALTTENLTESEQKKITCLKGFLSELPQNKIYDLITLWDVIEHIENPLEFLLEIRKYLSPKGTLIIETGNATYFWKGMGMDMMEWIYQQDHRWYFGFPSILRLLDKIDFYSFFYTPKTLREGSEITTRLKYLKYLIKCPLRFLKGFVRSPKRILSAFRYPQNAATIFVLACRRK